MWSNLHGLVDSNFLANYYKGNWKSCVLRWFSSTQAGTHTENHLADRWDGLFYDDGSKIELEKLGSEVQLSTGLEDILNLPYPSKLRPIDDYSFLRKASQVILVNIQFFAFDVSKGGSAEQNADVNTAITNSLSSSANDSYVQTRFFANMPVDWQPNYFRPKVKINGHNILKFYENSAFRDGISLGSGGNKADLSLGEFIPYDLNLYQLINESVSAIDVEAIVAQRVVEGANQWLKRYPLMCRMFMTYKI